MRGLRISDCDRACAVECLQCSCGVERPGIFERLISHTPTTPLLTMRRSSSVLSSYSVDSESEIEEGPSTIRGSTSNLDSPRVKRVKGSGTRTKSSVSDKESRKAARMVRNRHAAQASRDRKKEHTQLLEQRIAELEAQIQDHTEIDSPKAQSTTESESQPLIIALEEENDTLRSALELEKSQTAKLRKRLENLEIKFTKLEHILEPTSLLGIALPPLPTTLSPSLSLSALPLDELPVETATMNAFEPVFSFSPQDTLNLSRGSSPVSERMETEEDVENTIDCSRLVAREDDTPLPRKQSICQPSSIHTPISLSKPLSPPLSSPLSSNSTTRRRSLHEILSQISVPKTNSMPHGQTGPRQSLIPMRPFSTSTRKNLPLFSIFPRSFTARPSLRLRSRSRQNSSSSSCVRSRRPSQFRLAER